MIDEDHCEVFLQDSLNHVCSRLLKHLGLEPEVQKNLNLIFKYGMDGTNIEEYRQKMGNYSNEKKDKILASSWVPLRLVDSESNEEVWKNPAPSSPRFCVPIEIVFQKKTDDLCREKEEYYKSQIENLKDFKSLGITVKFRGFLTMVDGKVSCFSFNFLIPLIPFTRA